MKLHLLENIKKHNKICALRRNNILPEVLTPHHLIRTSQKKELVVGFSCCKPYPINFVQFVKRTWTTEHNEGQDHCRLPQHVVILQKRQTFKRSRDSLLHMKTMFHISKIHFFFYTNATSLLGKANHTGLEEVVEEVSG